MTIAKKIEKSLKRINNVRSVLEGRDLIGVDVDELLKSIDIAEVSLKCLDRKPIIAAFGLFDAGKSTLQNTIINQQALPEKYQPATSVVNLLMHISEKPKTISSDVAVFKKGFKPYMINDKALVEKYLLAQGDVTILEYFGTHNYDERGDQYDVYENQSSLKRFIPKFIRDLKGNTKAKNEKAYLSVSFVDSEILKSIWLLDTPGDLNSSDSQDTEKALAGAELADGVLYVSSFNGFMNGNDVGFLSNLLRNKPPMSDANPLGHIIFVLSHCHDGIQGVQLDQIKNNTFKRCHKQLNDLVFEKWKDDGKLSKFPSPQSLSSRVRPFYRENSDYVDGIIREVIAMASDLNCSQEARVERSVKGIEQNIVSTLEAEISKVTNFKKDVEVRIKEVHDMEARFREKSTMLVTQFEELIKSCSSYSSSDKKQMSDYYKDTTHVESLTRLISETYTDKKEASEGIGNYLIQLLTARLEKIIIASGNEVSSKTDKLLSEWQKNTPNYKPFNACNDTVHFEHDIDGLGKFNARAAFIGGFAGLSSLGAMSIYVSTIASNLGAYILVGKAAGVLTTLGITSGVSTLPTIVAALGGPITIGIAIAFAIGYVFYRMAGGSWQKSLAKELIKALEKESVECKLNLEIHKFWVGTENAVNKGLNELKIETNVFIEKMKEENKIKYSPEDIDFTIDVISTAKFNY